MDEVAWRTQVRLARTFQERKVDFGGHYSLSGDSQETQWSENMILKNHFNFLLSTKQEWSGCQKGPEYDTQMDPRHKMGPEPEYLGHEPNT